MNKDEQGYTLRVSDASIRVMAYIPLSFIASAERVFAAILKDQAEARDLRTREVRAQQEMEREAILEARREAQVREVKAPGDEY